MLGMGLQETINEGLGLSAKSQGDPCASGAMEVKRTCLLLQSSQGLGYYPPLKVEI